MIRMWDAATVLLLLLLTLCSPALSYKGPQPAMHSWIRTETLRRENGQPSYNFSDAISSLHNLLAVGSSSANRGRGEVTIYMDTGSGLKSIAALRNPTAGGGAIGDQFGQSVLLFNYNGFKQVAIGSLQDITTSMGTYRKGCVYLYQQRVSNATLWDFIQVLTVPSGIYVTNFGRTLVYDGTQLLISAERVYRSGRRFVVTSINVIGTSDFIQSDGVEATIGGDPILIYRSVPDRNSRTYLAYHSTISDADYTLNSGKSIAIDGDRMAVGASFREQLKYGSGTDGDLEVSDTKYLDGTAIYNFNKIIVRKGGVLTVDHYDTVRNLGGVMTIKVKTLLYVEKGGLINLTAAGYPGGPTSFSFSQAPENGKGPGGGRAATSAFVGVYACDYSNTVNTGIQLNSVLASTNQRSLNSTLPFAEACGGGGSFGTRGLAGSSVACGSSGISGTSYGDSMLTVLHRGSGGGSGHPWKVGAGGAGGAGGGIVNIAAKNIINYGSIECDGGPGLDGGFFSGAGGGGSGGTILLIGDNLANYGKILARGGKGGVRAKGTGSGGDSTARGGDGGYGRVKFDFLQTQSHGTVIPQPKNITNYLGDVLLYRRNSTTKTWTLQAYLPRIPQFQFIGHSVALQGNVLAVASTQGTPVDPLEQVFLIDLSTVVNDTSSYAFTALRAPNPKKDRQFGYLMRFDNNTLVITASGFQTTFRGVTYIYQGRSFLPTSPSLPRLPTTTLLPHHSVAGDWFGSTLALDFPNLYVQLPLSDDEKLPVNTQRSTGNVMVFKYTRNISVSDSFITCDYLTITANVTLNCTAHMFAHDKYVSGDMVDLQFFSPQVDFKSIGVFTFQTRLTAVGIHPIYVSYRHQQLKTVSITVTGAIIPRKSNITCSPMAVQAGSQVQCHIQTNRGSGEDIAKREFDVIVWNMEDQLSSLEGELAVTPLGNFRSPPSTFVPTAPNATDYVTITPSVTFLRHGVYGVTFTTWRPGTYAVYAMYQLHPLQFPNPVIIDALPAVVNATRSYVLCPRVALPNRTLTCEVRLMSSTGVPTDISGFETTVTQLSTTKVGYSPSRLLSVSAVNSGEGRYTILIYPPSKGLLQVNITLGGVLIPVTPSVGVNVTNVYPLMCRTFPRLWNSFMILNQAAQARADSSMYGQSATNAYYSNGEGFCDDPNV